MSFDLSVISILNSDWLKLSILNSHWSVISILDSHWLILSILNSDWSILCSNQKEPKIEFPADEPIIQEVTDDNVVPASAITTSSQDFTTNTRVVSHLNTYVQPESE